MSLNEDKPTESAMMAQLDQDVANVDAGISAKTENDEDADAVASPVEEAPVISDIIVPTTNAKKPRAKPAPKKFDADGNVIKTPRKAPAPKLDADGNIMPKTPRKAATPKKPVKSEATIPQDDGAGDDPFIETVPVTPGATTPGTRPKATPRSRAQKRVNEVTSSGSPTPTKKARTTIAKEDLGSDGLPALSATDAIIFTMKSEGKNWKEIYASYTTMCIATKVLVQNLPAIQKRYQRMVVDRAVFSEKQIDVLMGIAKNEDKVIASQRIALQSEFDAKMKVLDGEKWIRIKKMIVEADKSSVFTAAQLQKKYDELVDTWVAKPSKDDTIAKDGEDAEDGDGGENGEEENLFVSGGEEEGEKMDVGGD